MSANEIERIKEEISGIDRLIELEKERTPAWLEILDVMKSGLEMNSMLNGRIIALGKRLDELESTPVITKDELVSKLAKLLGKTPEDIPAEDLEKLEMTMGIYKLLPKDKFEIKDSPFEEENVALKEVIEQVIIRIENETKEKLKSLEDKILIKELYNKGVRQLEREKYEDAKESFDKITNINPKIKEAWLNKGIALGLSGQIEKEIECYDKAIEIDENYQKARHNKENVLKENFMAQQGHQ